MQIRFNPLLLIVAAAMLFSAGSCQPAAKKEKLRTPTYLELSYHSGWAVRYMISIDSTGYYYFSKDYNNWCKGRVPATFLDSLLQQLLALKSDSTVKTRNKPCDDCGAANLKIVTGSDTSILFQAGQLHPLFYALIDTLYEKQKKWYCQPVDTLLIFETLHDLLPRPPPMIEPPPLPAKNKKPGR